jgi:cyclopropane fatty-acyl-phospholipid synthase-like methyltransferase
MFTSFINWTGRTVKRLRVFPLLRFKFVYFCDSILNSHAEEWDFALKFLPRVEKDTKNVCEVGASEGLFIYELRNRGYKTYGLDQRPFQEKLRSDITFLVKDYLKPLPEFNNFFDYIVSISTFEHMGTGEYGDKPQASGTLLALENSYHLLKDDGLLILTLPIDHYGYTVERVKEITKQYFNIKEIEVRKGMTCVALTKKSI